MPSLFSFCRSVRPHAAGLGALCLLVLGLAACDVGGECDLMAVSSLTINVSDNDGAPFEDASVRYSVDGGTVRDCEGNSGTWICGWEESGDFEVEVSSTGFETQTVTAQVEADECHVIPQSIDVALEPIECTEEIVSSVLLTLADNEGNTFEPGSGAWAQWSRADADMLPQPCVPSSDGRWECGSEQSGLFEIVAGRIGNYGASTEVEVAHDGCHPITEEVELELFTATIPCTDVVETSIVLTVVDDKGELVTGADVVHNSTWVPWMTSEPCFEAAAGEYHCGQELANSINVSVTENSEIITETIYVTSDECHVITEHRTIVLN
jgi:hypothetical protein